MTGSLAADAFSNVASNVNGIVVDIHVDLGSMVKKGEVMVQLDPTDPTNRLNEGLALAEELRTKLNLPEAAAALKVEKSAGRQGGRAV